MPSRKTFELLPGIATLALVVGAAGLLGPAMHPSSSGEDASVTASRELQAIAEAFLRYREDMGAWPDTGLSEAGAPSMFCAYLSGFDSLTEKPLRSRGWRGPYLRTEPPSQGRRLALPSCLDPWGRAYQVYRFPPHSPLGGNRGAIIALSLGPDGELDSPAAGIAVAQPSGDDLMVIVSR